MKANQAFSQTLLDCLSPEAGVRGMAERTLTEAPRDLSFFGQLFEVIGSSSERMEARLLAANLYKNLVIKEYKSVEDEHIRDLL